jgi:hypothetical protein
MMSVPVLAHGRQGLEMFFHGSNRRNAKKAGRPKGGMNADKLELSARCRVNDERHIKILQRIAQVSPNEGYQLTAMGTYNPQHAPAPTTEPKFPRRLASKCVGICVGINIFNG